ncbi:membrane protein [Virgibacillus pantothenticus]|uniref:lysoplasmalogenase n=1 Tax=Virgibacillus pantothenticus TaxID=1473 RepID=UPI001B0218B7|nr:lysoplasmalogenase [Virgibacillus pantothenticus]GIP63884.1 membrane protein [Virgibacillus pantothenticus]
MQANRLPVLILVLSILYIFIIPQDPLAFKLFFKLIPMALIIIYAFYQTPKQKTIVHWLILIGLFFCSIGDGTIQWFVVGLSAFLIGHLFYLTGFVSQWKFSKYRVASIIPIGIYAWIMGNELVQAISNSEDTYLVIPVIIYIAAIASMAWFAIMTGNIFASIGSILFVISDSILAWNMFVSPVNYEHVFVMVTYYAAQFFIAHSLKSLGRKHTQLVW